MGVYCCTISGAWIVLQVLRCCYVWLGPLSFHCHIIIFEPKKHDTLHKLMGTVDGDNCAGFQYLFHPESMNVSHTFAGL